MARERQLLEGHARSTSTFTLQGWSAEAEELRVNFQLEMLKGTFDGVLVYPEFFPEVPAFVRPQRPGENWSTHQYLGAGVLCLQYGPDNWHRDITGVDLVKSANTLLWSELISYVMPDLGPVSSRHVESAALTLSRNRRRLVVTGAMLETLAGRGQSGPLPLKGAVALVADESVAMVTAMGDPFVALFDVPQVVAEEPAQYFLGVAVPVPSVSEIAGALDVNDLAHRMGELWPWSDGIEDESQLLVAHDADGGICPFLLKGGSQPLFQRYHPLRCNTEDAQRLPGSFKQLSEVSVAIVGVGSLGSKVAVSLARAGVRQFLLVDDDVLGPQNLVRNELDWKDVGFSKVEAVRRALRLVAPNVEVKTRFARVAAQTNPSVEAGLTAELAACTLVVDATANPRGFLPLAALTKRAKASMVWGEIFAGGGGCLMARSRPGRDADALSVRTHIYGVMEGFAPPPKAKTEAYGVESAGTVYVASDADVSALAGLMTQFCLDTLCAEDSDYPVAAYLIGFRKFWEFRCPFDVIPVDCSGAMQPEPDLPMSADDEASLAALYRSISGGTSAANHGAD